MPCPAVTYTCAKKLHPRGQTAVILLIVTIGLLNICLGFGLAMYYGFGPPGLDGIFQAIGPMPRPAPDAKALAYGGIGAPYDPLASPQSPVQPAANLPASSAVVPPSEPLAEEEVLGDVRDLASTAQTAMASNPGA